MYGHFETANILLSKTGCVFLKACVSTVQNCFLFSNGPFWVIFYESIPRLVSFVCNSESNKVTVLCIEFLLRVRVKIRVRAEFRVRVVIRVRVMFRLRVGFGLGRCKETKDMNLGTLL